VGQAHRPVTDVDYGDFAPRISFAWNPAAKGGFLGALLGDRKTSIRGGFAMIYDRTNTVQTVLIPMLGVGFGQTINIGAPTCNATGAGGPGCNPTSSNPALSSFRVGVDGSLPLPTPSTVTSPVVPPLGTYSELLSFQDDPYTKIGRSYNTDLSIQRELPGNMVLEVAFIGRNSRRLPQAVNLSNAPYMFVDSASNQSFAQAFDSVANALRGGQTPATQPWFENQLPGIAGANGTTGTSTAYVAANLRSSFTTANVPNLFFVLDRYRRQLKLPVYDNDQSQVLFMRTYIGQSNYAAGIITLSKRFSRGLAFSANYTYSKALDDNVLNQNQAFFYGNGFHPGVDYGPTTYDRRHIFNAYYTYELPAGKGHRLSTGNFVDRILGGWYASGIYTANTGLPLFVTTGANAFGGSLQGFAANTNAILTAPVSDVSLNNYNSSCKNEGANSIGPGGSGINVFSDPCAVFSSARYLNLSTDTRTGRANPFYGLKFWNFDMSFGKRTPITEKVALAFSADMFNVFNHHTYNNPSISLQNPNSFGVVTSTFVPANRTNSARWIEFGMRLEF
jgi:hypothetical protein